VGEHTTGNPSSAGDGDETPPNPDGADRERLVRVLVAISYAAEFVALSASSPAEAMTAGLLAWTLRVLLED